MCNKLISLRYCSYQLKVALKLRIFGDGSYEEGSFWESRKKEIKCYSSTIIRKSTEINIYNRVVCFEQVAHFSINLICLKEMETVNCCSWLEFFPPFLLEIDRNAIEVYNYPIPRVFSKSFGGYVWRNIPKSQFVIWPAAIPLNLRCCTLPAANDSSLHSELRARFHCFIFSPPFYNHISIFISFLEGGLASPHRRRPPLQ